MLDADYFRRIDALNFTMLHDDGHLPRNLDDADIVLVGISRTSKTPTAIYLANRGIKTANVPLVPGVPLPPTARSADASAFVVGLVASPERIVAGPPEPRASSMRITTSTTMSTARRSPTRSPRPAQLCARHGWPIIDVTRRSIEETAAAIIAPLSRPRSAGARSMSSFLQAGRPPLILASTSKSRARLLEAAGLAFIVEPPGLDEGACARPSAASARSSPHDVAEVLARAKAEAVSELAPQAS